MTFILLLAISAQSFSQTCAQKLERTKKSSYIDRLSDDQQQILGFVSTTGGLAVGLTVASGAFPVFLVAVGIASAPILAGEAIKGVHNRPINRMIKLIKQSEELVANPNSKPGRLLRRLKAKLSNEKLEVSELDLATAIASANKDPQQCGQIYRMKYMKEEIESGRLPVIDMDEDDSRAQL